MAQVPPQLSTLPHEILERILSYTTDQDLICMGRLNTFYANLAAPILTHRITRHVQKEGWRLLVNVSCVSGGGMAMVGDERRILGEHVNLDPDTLHVRFVALPVDDQDQFTAANSTDGRAITASESAEDMFDDDHIRMELYLTKVVNKRMEVGAFISGLSLTPPYRRNESKLDYRDHINFGSETPVTITYHVTDPSSSSSDHAEITYDVETIETTPEWWISQLSKSYEGLMPLPMVW